MPPNTGLIRMSSERRYDVELTRNAEKDLDCLIPCRERVVRELLRLEGDPFLGHTVSGSLRQARSLGFSLPERGACRAVNVIDDDETVCVVFIVGPHEDIYANAQSRYEALLRQLGRQDAQRGAGGRIRTCVCQLGKQPLCLLSYTHIVSFRVVGLWPAGTLPHANDWFPPALHTLITWMCTKWRHVVPIESLKMNLRHNRRLSPRHMEEPRRDRSARPRRALRPSSRGSARPPSPSLPCCAARPTAPARSARG